MATQRARKKSSPLTDDKRHKILYDLTGSSNKNTFRKFWENIMKLSTKKIMTEKEFEENRLNISCYNKITILDALFPNCVVLPTSIFQVCKENHIHFVHEDLITHYLPKIVNEMQKYTDVYFIQALSIRGTKKDDSHAITLIVSPYDDTIYFVDPVSSKMTSEYNDVFFTILHQLYARLDKTIIRTSVGKEYVIDCPQLYSENDIQELLGVNKIRKGPCSIISILIPHVMVYTRQNGINAINTISAYIKEHRTVDIHLFADGYTEFLSTLADYHPPPRPSIYDTMDKATIDQFNSEKMYLELLNKLREENKITFIQHRLLTRKFIEVSVKGYSKWYRSAK